MTTTSSDTISVLHVDDEPAFSELTMTFLEREDDRFVVDAVTGASEALEYLTENDVDCVVSDYDMPERNGIELLEAIREDHPDLPFILYTGKGSEEIASEAISAGVTDYLQKKSETSQYTVLANRIVNAVEGTRARRERKRHLEAIETAKEGISILENDRFVYVNEAYADLYGYDPEEMVGEHWGLIYPDGDIPHVRDKILSTVRETGQWHGTTTGLRADGTTFIEDHTLAVAESGELVCTVRDITEQKRREQELERYEKVLEAAADAVYALDLDGRFTMVNEHYLELTGYDRKQLLGNHVSIVLDEEDIEDAEALVRELLTTDRTVAQHEETIHTADGREVPTEVRMAPLEADDGTVRGTTGVIRNITERKQQKRELERQNRELEELAAKLEEQYQTLFEEAPIMAVVTRTEDGAPVIEDCNSQFVETLGYDRETLLGRELAEFYATDSEEILLDEGGYRRSLEGEFTRERRTLLDSDGEPVETILRAVPRRDASGDVVGTLAMYIDISEREAAKRANDHLEDFTRFVSHDLRSPLQVASGRLELVREDCDSEHLSDIARAHDRMEALITDLLRLARRGQPVEERSPVDIARILEDCWKNVETGDATLVLETDRTVLADENRLKQVFENLIRNTVEHAGDTVTVTVGDLEDGFYIEDDGPGIPPAKRDEVFDPGYSTGEEGTGFGLSIVKRVVDAHDWTITVTEGDSGGARFEITGVDDAGV